MNTNKLKPIYPQTIGERAVGMCVLKTLWEKEKLLVTSNFFFSISVFYPFEEISAIFIKFKI